MKITQKSIIEDIKKAVGTSDIIPDSCYGEDYFSYRYKWNTERPFVLIRAYGESQLNVIVGKSEYTIRDDETYEALKPLIAKKVKSEFKSIRSEIVFQDKEMAVILQKHERDCSMVLITAYENYRVSHHSGLSNNVYIEGVPLNILEKYMEFIKEYFIPFTKKENV